VKNNLWVFLFWSTWRLARFSDSDRGLYKNGEKVLLFVGHGFSCELDKPNLLQILHDKRRASCLPNDPKNGELSSMNRCLRAILNSCCFPSLCSVDEHL
jgi:hypothetical protein